MSSVLSLIKLIIPYTRYLPLAILTLPASLALHIASHPSPTPLSFLKDPLTNPIHLPLLFCLGSIPVFYTLGILTGNVSWVDRSWPFYTPICSGLIMAWAVFNDHAGVYGHNLPRLIVMIALQMIWSTRLLSHALRRGFYDFSGEDYRYTQFRKIVPRWLFALVHLFAVAIAQPLLLLSLSLPMHSILVLPPSELSPGPIPRLSLPFSIIQPFLPSAYTTAPSDIPILNSMDLFLIFLSLTLVYIEYTADNAMYAYQTAKHNDSSKQIVSPTPTSSNLKPSRVNGAPGPAKYPRSFHPGFKLGGLWRYSRHPNFAAEQLFWLTQALFVVAAGESSGVTRTGWVGGSVFGPALGLSLLFCASTFLTEWITECKYPAYGAFRGLVGQFLPQETAIKYIWSVVSGQRPKWLEELSSPPSGK
ncbi:hypothetical protein BCR39DRAFT_540401 [Naematelia encephala]|uniref:Steroid 5-alpha reductase C-terminal domain-containing protein n=1 Tax=Naematelia encephala TaxID=71784 RepID=A0A1Y2AVR8_9TREE|nr:hypothetical protein BCR39DRAFT_540401 [Naematelia encephala]